MAYYIGSREFDDLQGDIVLPTPSHSVESRAGQDGVVIFSTGARGKEFELTSQYHVTTYAAAAALMAEYYAEPSPVARNIIRGTEDYTSASIGFVVLAVDVSIQSKILWTGLRYAGRVLVSPAHCVTAKWRLIAVGT